MLQPAHRHRGAWRSRRTRWASRRLQLHPRRDLRGLLRFEEPRFWRRPAPPATWATTSSAANFASSSMPHHGWGAYICGEETGAAGIARRQEGQPRFKPPFPAASGLYGKPTTINNTETFAAVPWIIRHGGAGVPDLGKPNNGGTKIFSVSATSNGPATTRSRWAPVRQAARAGGRRARRKLKAVIPGGSSAPVLPASIDDGPDDGLRLHRQRPARCWARAP